MFDDLTSRIHRSGAGVHALTCPILLVAIPNLSAGNHVHGGDTLLDTCAIPNLSAGNHVHGGDTLLDTCAIEI
jgi:hypothetical protein